MNCSIAVSMLAVICATNHYVPRASHNTSCESESSISNNGEYMKKVFAVLVGYDGMTLEDGELKGVFLDEAKANARAAEIKSEANEDDFLAVVIESELID
jgi:hypothetical protein